MTNRLKRRSTNVVELVGCQDQITLAYPVNLTVTFDLLDPTGAVVLAAQPMTYVNGTSGALTTYRGTIPKTQALSIGNYTARVTATDTSSNAREFNISVPAQDG